jgi:hypothetical protein
MTNLTKEFTKGEFYTIYTYASDAAIFGEILSVSEHGVYVRGYSKVPSRWVSFRSIASAHRANVSRLMNVKGK